MAKSAKDNSAENHVPWPQNADRTPRFSIGQVTARLQNEFPSLTQSKIRYIEDTGVFEATRSAGGIRKFSEANIERIRYYLVAQRDSYLPVDAILANLEKLDQGESVEVTPVARIVSNEGMAIEPLEGSEITRRDLEDFTGAHPEEIDELISVGVLQPNVKNRFPASAVKAVRLSRMLSEAGITYRRMRPLTTFASRISQLAAEATQVDRAKGSVAHQRRLTKANDIAKVAAELAHVLTRQDIDRNL
ncbi:hypothetical protein [Boudabousia tangfeifanii]|uniref:transcriptional regulator FtsR n=1 Tax=Boudabousia tangfeifanii TaxID=1912795 RepID=UPI0012EE068B|nr:hypothetical protein [Boudabousia tangfeifanii]